MQSDLLEECLEELRLYTFNQILTEEQFIVFIDKKAGCTAATVISAHGLCKTSYIHCITRTAEGRRWFKGMGGGRDTYLGDIDTMIFASMLNQAADDLNCLCTETAMTLALSLKTERIKKAKFLLENCGCAGLIEGHLPEPTLPSKAWLKEFCSSLDLTVGNPQTIEAIRRSSCDINGILAFFAEHSILIDRHPSLILNMDETMLSARKKFKVICGDNHLPLTPTKGAYPHLTGVVTISAWGKCFDPMIILPNKKTARGLEDFDCFLTSSSSGWMTKRLFLIYCINLISQIQIYRLTLPPDLKDEPFLLIVDGHVSRASFYANFLLLIFNIDLLLLPPHSSHIMQPFDVSISAALKTEFSKQLQKVNVNINLTEMKIEEIIKMTSQEMRYLLVETFISALRKVSIRNNIRSGFSASGLFPLDPSVPLTSRYIMPTAISPKRTNFISNKFLNEETVLQQLFHNEFKREMTISDLQFDIKEFIFNEYYKKSSDGIALVPCPPILINQENLDTNCFFNISS